MKVLFITRKYPPQTGGMENCMYGIINNYPGHKVAITLGKPQIHLIWFYPCAFLKALWIIRTQSIDLVHLGDAVMTPMGWLLNKLTGKKLVMSAHGLDINYGNRVYQLILPWFYRQIPHVAANSQATRDICVKHGVPSERIRIITPGISPEEWECGMTKDEAREIVQQEFGLDLKDKFVILSVGRLSSRRKGYHWFIDTVVPLLDDHSIYLVVGSGEQHKTAGAKTELEKIEETIKNKNLGNKVKLLGKLPHDMKKIALCASDVHIMPNIPVEGDLEGFGMVCPEAAALGLPSVTSRMEGMLDAVVENETGYYAEPENPRSFIEQFDRIDKLHPKQVAESARNHFDWKIIAQQYHDYFRFIVT